MQKNLKKSQNVTSYVQDFPVKHFHWLVNEEDSQIQGEQSSLKLPESLKNQDLDTYSLKTLKVCCSTKKVKPSKSCWKHWMNWGMMSNGNVLTVNIIQDKTVKESLLSDILEKRPLDKSFLYKLELKAHTKANIKKRIQYRNTTWTLDTSKSKFYVNDEPLTEIECERLQGFPDNWTDNIPSSQRYKCIGNAVTVPIVEYIGKYIM